LRGARGWAEMLREGEVLQAEGRPGIEVKRLRVVKEGGTGIWRKNDAS